MKLKKKLNKKLLIDPFTPISENELNQIIDKDVKFNYQMILNFREFLSKSNNLEEAYLKFCRGEKNKLSTFVFRSISPKYIKKCFG